MVTDHLHNGLSERNLSLAVVIVLQRTVLVRLVNSMHSEIVTVGIQIAKIHTAPSVHATAETVPEERSHRYPDGADAKYYCVILHL